MSNALAIAAVTAALKDLVGNGLLGLDLSSIGSVTVSALPPDRIATGQTASERIMSPQYCVDRHGHTRYAGDEDVSIIWGDARA